MAAQCGNAVPALGGVEDMLICDLEPGHDGGHSALNPDGSRVSWMPLAASTTETAKPSNQELAHELIQAAANELPPLARQGALAELDALLARVEALLAERDALERDHAEFRAHVEATADHLREEVESAQAETRKAKEYQRRFELKLERMRHNAAEQAGRVAVLEAALRGVTKTDWDANEGITPFQFEQRVHGIAARGLGAVLAGGDAAPPRSVESLLDEDDLAVIRMEDDRSGGDAAAEEKPQRKDNA